MAYNTAITFPPKSHTHSEYSKTDHTHSGYAVTSHTHTGYAASTHGHTPGYVNSTDVWDHQGLINAIAITDTSYWSTCNAFRTACQGHAGTGNFVTTVRNATGSTLGYLPAWDVGLAWGGADTEGFLIPGRGASYICYGSNNANEQLTVRQLAYSDWVVYQKNNSPETADGTKDGYYILHSPSQHIAHVTAWIQRDGTYISSNCAMPSIGIVAGQTFPCVTFGYYAYGTATHSYFGIGQAETNTNPAIMMHRPNNRKLFFRSSLINGLGNELVENIYFCSVTLKTT